VVDQVTGKSEPIPLPSEDIWALLTVSPWRDRDGNLEVVGRWARHLDPPGERPFSGLGRFRLPDATVISRIPIDIIPTGRPCVLPGRAGEILFPSGDGQLYRCNISEDTTSESRTNSGENENEAEDSVPGSLRRVKWRCARPSAGQIYISEPHLSAVPRLRNYVFVSLSAQKQLDKKVQQELPKLWWLRMNDRFDVIEAAGPLTGEFANHNQRDPIAERFPTIAPGSEHRLSMIYITRKPPERGWRLQFSMVELDPKTGEPRVTSRENTAVALAEDIAADYPLISADSKSAFARSATGQLITVKLPVDR
jgi:hypothetical protein